MPKQLIRIINKCLSVDPAKRYQSVIAVLNALSDIDDKGLDWRHTENETTLLWIKTVESTKVTLEVEKDTRKSICYTTDEVKGTRRRDLVMCRNSITDEEVSIYLKGK